MSASTYAEVFASPNPAPDGGIRYTSPRFGASAGLSAPAPAPSTGGEQSLAPVVKQQERTDVKQDSAREGTSDRTGAKALKSTEVSQAAEEESEVEMNGSEEEEETQVPLSDIEDLKDSEHVMEASQRLIMKRPRSGAARPRVQMEERRSQAQAPSDQSQRKGEAPDLVQPARRNFKSTTRRPPRELDLRNVNPRDLDLTPQPTASNSSSGFYSSSVSSAEAQAPPVLDSATTTSMQGIYSHLNASVVLQRQPEGQWNADSWMDRWVDWSPPRADPGPVAEAPQGPDARGSSGSSSCKDSRDSDDSKTK